MAGTPPDRAFSHHQRGMPALSSDFHGPRLGAPIALTHRMSSPRPPSQNGSSLLEAVIAAGLLATVLAAVLPLVTSSSVAVAAIRADLLAQHLVRQRLSQLQALAHLRSTAGLVVDQQTRLDGAEPFAVGGSGLVPTGLVPLLDTTAAWADWLDQRGVWHGAGTDRPPGARFRRRWGILAAGPDSCLRLWVEVSALGPSVGDRVARAGGVHCPWGAVLP